MKRLLSRLLLIAVTVGLMLASAQGYAQSKAKVYIPFAFTASDVTMPAGHYTVERMSYRLLCFRNSKTGEHHAFIMVHPDKGNYIETRGRLRFLVAGDRGDRHYLTDISFAGSSMHSKPVMTPSLERELAKNAQAEPPIEIAMK